MTTRRRKVLLPIDFSAGTRAAIGSLDLLSAQGPMALHLVHVVEPLHFAAPPPPVWVDYVTARERQARRALERVAERVRRRFGAKVQVEAHVLTAGSAHDAICKFARTLNADLIVIATHGRTGMPHLLLGSVAERVLRHAHRPVLSVPVSRGSRRSAR
jgi:nucleotide-binding universal stress UspA family protein